MADGRMTREEREAFLAGLHVGVIAIPEPGRGPLTAPIWYAYEPGGDVVVVTERGSRKGRLLGVGTSVSLCAQSEAPPYQYVSVEGEVVEIAPADRERDVRPLAHRYLGKEMGDAYVAVTSAEQSTGESVRVRIRPRRWLTVDYRKQYASGT